MERGIGAASDPFVMGRAPLGRLVLRVPFRPGAHVRVAWMEGVHAMVAVVLCAAFSGLTGFGISLAMVEGLASGPGSPSLALGAAGLACVVSWHLRSV